MILQPVPFQTNQYWAEEIEAGPGPPRGWRKHSLDDRTKRAGSAKKKGKKPKKSVFAPVCQVPTDETSPPASSSSDAAPQMMEPQATRLSRRASLAGATSTLDALRDTIKSTIARPDNWNWKRYEREDETLFGINDKISRMWDRATQHGRQASTDRDPPPTTGRRRAATTASDDHSWLYARNPGVNELHPPTVSQLPRTQREVAWMMQPPPSRAVMEGKVRPGTESGNRRPLCTIRRPSMLAKDSDRAEDEEVVGEGGSITPERKQPPDIIISPDGTEQTKAAEDEDDGDDEEGSEQETEATSNFYYLSSRSPSLLPYPSSPPSLSPTQSSLIPRRASPLTRPPLAVLVDSQAPSKFHSYQVSTSSPKLATVNDEQTSSPPPRLTELDVWMGVVLPHLPERSRYSLPNVRLGEF
ncbi:hypothetical protein EPUS_06184 [Endocarpon pusillum Z07020]|uniref:Uncharacterized protein n=1 Tax=Endocarpon pusillum (strain Z07020 / HMAS-L-300199) TaxID=1263415 RepID=U1I003_ENDPU|nr:uncharacterized protein EPUS_06184 [Endocarpon pusillum Z07020]ERF75144.1 hypothetical protein EPUS_06184 [Endocarpon pusillum Z07020]